MLRPPTKTRVASPHGRTTRARAPPPLAAAAAAAEDAEEVVIDIGLDHDEETGSDPTMQPPPPPRKTIYNPHRTLYIIVWINFALLLLLAALFAVYVATRPNPLQQQQQQQQRQPYQERSVVHRSLVFTLDVDAAETLLPLPEAEFDAHRLVDMTVCCTDVPPDHAVVCTRNGIHISEGVVRISGQAQGGSGGGCRFSWSQQRH
jgi:hypothetical protein